MDLFSIASNLWRLLTTTYVWPIGLMLLGIVVMGLTMNRQMPSANISFWLLFFGGTLLAIGTNLVAIQIHIWAFYFVGAITFMCCAIGLWIVTWPEAPLLIKIGFLVLIFMNVSAVYGIQPYTIRIVLAGPN